MSDADVEPVPAYVPARMLNEFVYCPRLAYLEWVDRLFRDSGDTVEGRDVHRRVDVPRGRPPEPGDQGERPPSTSVTLSSDRLGLTAVVDLLDAAGDAVVPVDYKRGSPRDGEVPVWEPELAQVTAQVLLLRDAGYRVDHAEVWFAETRTRHRVESDDATVAWTETAVRELRSAVAADAAPPPLVDSPKCPRCSLVSICLPDEVNLLAERVATPPRRLIAGEPPGEPLVATTPGSRLVKRQGRVVLVEKREEVASRRLIDVSHIALHGNVDVSSALVRACLEEGIPVVWFTAGGWYSGMAAPAQPGNVRLRARQHRAAALGAPEVAAAMVAGKIRNQRTLLRRHGGADVAATSGQLGGLARQADDERVEASLLGLEGMAARLYFERFSRLVHPIAGLPGLDVLGRNRRPPRDPVNAVLSFVYALLVRDATVALHVSGLDPFVGLFHRPRFGRPSLALDLVEEFRPLVGDSTVLMAFNNGEVGAASFVRRAGACALTAGGRKAVVGAYERRMASEITHPIFGYRVTYRRCVELQARLLGAYLLGEFAPYRSLTAR